jgi:hypothetical protein
MALPGFGRCGNPRSAVFHAAFGHHEPAKKIKMSSWAKHSNSSRRLSGATINSEAVTLNEPQVSRMGEWTCISHVRTETKPGAPEAWPERLQSFRKQSGSPHQPPKKKRTAQGQVHPTASSGYFQIPAVNEIHPVLPPRSSVPRPALGNQQLKTRPRCHPRLHSLFPEPGARSPEPAPLTPYP